MKSQIKHFLFTSSLFLSAQALGQEPAELDAQILNDLAEKYDVQLSVLEDFSESYNFKCPQILSANDLVTILNTESEDTELSIMLESDRLQWRDIYVEARSGISCLQDGLISKGY